MSQAFPIVADPRFRLSTASSNQTAFSVNFPFLGADEITVYKIALNGTQTLLARPANYTVTGAGNPAGGTVTLKAGVPAGTKILVVGAASRARAQSVVRGGKYSTAATDQDFDRLTLIAQELDREDQRTIKVPYGSTPPTVTAGADNATAIWSGGNLVPGPDSTALQHIDTALAVDAGRALIYPPAPAAEVYDAHNRPIRNVAAGVDSTDAVNKGQLDTLTDSFGLDEIEARFDAIETYAAQGWQTGDLKIAMSDDDQTGWLKVNGLTIGDESSGGTARADDDCAALFTLIWTKFDNTASHIQGSNGTPTTRGASAAADWAAHRRLPLLAAGGEFLRFLDMGRGVDAGRGLGSAQAQQLLQHGHTATFTGIPHHHSRTAAGYHGTNGTAGRRGFADGDSSVTSSGSVNNNDSTAGGTVAVDDSAGGAENRVRNIAFPLFVKL